MRQNAPSLARLVDIASEGISDWLWRSMADPEQTALDVGTARAERESGCFSYTNAIVVEFEDQVVGMMLGYTRTNSCPVLWHPCQPYYDKDVLLLKKKVF